MPVTLYHCLPVWTEPCSSYSWIFVLLKFLFYVYTMYVHMQASLSKSRKSLLEDLPVLNESEASSGPWLSAVVKRMTSKLPSLCQWQVSKISYQIRWVCTKNWFFIIWSTEWWQCVCTWKVTWWVEGRCYKGWCTWY